ncbi:MAG: polyprenol monophosphomannose synthase [Patescibacteria group bacterium]
MKNLIIIPTYNERANIAPLVKEILAIVPAINILVVDDNSPDGTQAVVRELSGQYPNISLLLRECKEGLAKAYLAGFAAALTKPDVDRIITMDADFSHQPEYLPTLLAAGSNFEVVVGSRYVQGGGTSGWELWRRVLSRCGNIYARLITGLPLHDCTGGFNLISLKALRRINLSDIDLQGYAFLMELKWLLWQAGASLTEVPIIFKNRSAGKSKMSGHIIREGIIAPWQIRHKHKST